MTRNELLTYIADTHGVALQSANVALTDTPETLAYVLHDACQYEDATTQRAVVDREIAQLIIDKKAAIQPAPVGEE